MKKLTDVSPSLYRVREGGRLIVYVIEGERPVVPVVRIAQRTGAHR